MANGRWARKRACPGPRATTPARSLFDAGEGMLELRDPCFTVYAFSTENWRRPPDDVRFLMNVNQIARPPGGRAHGKGSHPIRRASGLARAPSPLRRIGSPRPHRGTIAPHPHHGVNYGGRADIVDAVLGLVASSSSSPRVDELPSGPTSNYPRADPDLVIRTSESSDLQLPLVAAGLPRARVHRRSVADFRRQHLFEAVREFQRRDRRYGGVEA